MQSTTRNTLTTLAMVVLTVGLFGCSSATPTDTPGVDRLGANILRQEGPEIDVVLGYKFASTTIGDDWLILELGLSSPAKTSAEVQRENIWVRTPDGIKIPVATQELFGKAYSELRKVIAAADVAREPMDYFPASRRPCEMNFFVAPGEGVVYDKVGLNDRRACEGRLFFKVPGGIDPGRWTLGIDLEESTVRIPFDL